jgi:hypothetical protein
VLTVSAERENSKVLIALTGCPGPALAALVSGIFLLISKDPPATTPTVAPTEVVLADQVSGLTAKAGPTQALTTEKPGGRPQGLICRHDDFDTLDRVGWGLPAP